MQTRRFKCSSAAARANMFTAPRSEHWPAALPIMRPSVSCKVAVRVHALLASTQCAAVPCMLPCHSHCMADALCTWQVEEKGAVSQDLELYISKDHHEDGFTLIARSEVSHLASQPACPGFRFHALRSWTATSSARSWIACSIADEAQSHGQPMQHVWPSLQLWPHCTS